MAAGSATKNGEPRVLVLNDIAQAVIEEARSQHRTYVRGAEQPLGTRKCSSGSVRSGSGRSGCTTFATPSVGGSGRRG
jgi:hypothetical protein